MKVILREDLKGKGEAGDVINVADGYARNYLIPRGIAVEATAGALKAINEHKDAILKKKDREGDDARALADRINGMEVSVSAKVGESGRLFGSVTAMDVAEAISKEARADIDKRKIDVTEAIKSVGAHTVTLRLHPGVTAEVTVNVIEETS